jgi:hypothetical protein
LATSSKIAFNPFPENHASAKSADGGETIRYAASDRTLAIRGRGLKSLFFMLFRDEEEEVVNSRAKDNGEARRPITSAREKLIVAQVESTAPRKSNENDWRVWSCCVVAAKMRVRRMLLAMGRR